MADVRGTWEVVELVGAVSVLEDGDAQHLCLDSKFSIAYAPFLWLTGDNAHM